MPLSIKLVREILDDVIAQGIGITEDSDVLFTVGEPAQGGVIHLATDTSVASRDIDGKEVSTFFFHMDTVANVVMEGLPTIAGVNSDRKEAVKEDS